MSAIRPWQWPKEVSDGYTPVRVIGKGGFASVWMAKTKKKSSADDDNVAIKIMQDDGYAKREIEILSELTNKYAHPNIVRLIQNFRADTHDECNGPGEPAVNCIVLSLARGPSLTVILKKGGALGLVIAQSISRQLIDAVAFLHGHAVIHRDIQPSNIIVSGSRIDDDLWWSDDLDIDGKVLTMANQCHITLIDFGFARALSSTDIKTDIGLRKLGVESERTKTPEVEDTAAPVSRRSNSASYINKALDDNAQDGKSSGRGRSRERNFDNSVSHQQVRDLSALGTRNYAAPEIISGIRKFADNLNDSISKRSKSTTSLGACVSNYGMDADAFSVGATIRHMVTGVSPGTDVEEFIARKNHPMKKLVRSLSKRVTKKKSQGRKKKYRLGTDLPEEVDDLVEILTHYNSRIRATVRSVTSHPWIQSSSPSKGAEEKKHGGPIKFLQCAGNHDK